MRSFPRSLRFTAAAFLLLFIATLHALAQEPTSSPAAAATPVLTADQKKKIADVEAAIRSGDLSIKGAEERRRSASALVDRLKALTSSKKGDQAALRDFEDLVDVVATVDGTKFCTQADADHPVLKDLAAAEKRINDAKAALPAGDGLPPEIGTARTAAEEAAKRFKPENDAVTQTRTDLRNAAASVYTFAAAFPEVLQTRVKTLTDLPANATVDQLRPVLPRQLSIFRAVQQISSELNRIWPELNARLKPLAVGTDPGVDGKLTAVRTGLATIQGRLVSSVKDDPATTNVNENDAWLTRLASDGVAQTSKITTYRNQVRQDPVAFSAVAVDALRDYGPLVDDLRTLQLEWTATEAQLLDTNDLGFNRIFADQAADQVESSLRLIRGALADLQDALAGDMSKFEADQVSLFYFTDVPRLMRMLNSESYEVGGIRTASEEAASRRRELTNADLDLADAQSAVNAAQQRLLVLREELRQANDAADGMNAIFKKTTLALRSAQRDQTSNNQRFTDGGCDPMPADPAARAKCDKLATERDKAAARVTDAERRNQDADEDHKRATERSVALRDEQNGLPSRIAEAESKLETAQAAVNRQRRSALLAAQAESEAFARSRDNRPFWVAPVNGTSTDPVKRVFLWAFNDNKTVFMRGPRADMDYVKCIIAKIDQPAPQARMTLWTLEISSDSSVGGAKRTNESLELVDRHLSNSRVLNAAALSLFRDAVNRHVNIAGNEALTRAKLDCPAGRPCAKDLAYDADAERLARLTFYHPEILKRLGFDPDHLFEKRYTDPLLARLILPDPAGTTTLGEALMVLSLGRQRYRADIINTFMTSLGEQLPQLGLKSLPKELAEIVDTRKPKTLTWFPSLKRALGLDGFASADFSKTEKLPSQALEGLRAMVAQRQSPGTPAEQEALIKTVANANSRMDQRNLVAGITGLDVTKVNNLFGGGTSSFDGLSFSQLEILHALEEVAQDRLFAYFKTLLNRYVERKQEIDAKRAAAGLVGPPSCPTDEEFEDLKRDAKTISELEAAEKVRRARLTEEQRQAEDSARAERQAAQKKVTAEKLDQIKNEAKDQGRSLTDQEAQQILEDRQVEARALENEYCRLGKMLRNLVGKLGRTGFTWERIQKYQSASQADRPAAEAEFMHDLWRKTCATGLRTANAREAAADQMLKEMIIAVEDDLDRLFVQPMLKGLREDLQRKGIGVGIVQRTSVLATNRLLARVEPRASAQLPLGETTDVLQAAQQLSEIFFAAQAAGPLGALGALKGLPRAPQGELYGLTTGNVFQVTPVFDPSGQALRFRFDYVNASQIQEPNGTVNPQLPRIERHTVNTEVQLSNLELREISRYESNARLGIATRYAGGLPIFKDIPYIRYIPLIGWFVRTSGKAAVSQESLIFGQTTMYPTIGDIMGLLTTEVDVDLTKGRIP
ncbi:MAG TPA: hypothetical protein VN659_11670 [Pyrinomonadaceae bacterium]|nr:hypothetical protein [Pyrinomonadaceae bacterium]